MPNNQSVNDIKPENIKVSDIKPINNDVVDIKPLNNIALSNISQIYLENRTIRKGQPIPWGLNWLITYPVQLDFSGARL